MEWIIQLHPMFVTNFLFKPFYYEQQTQFSIIENNKALFWSVPEEVKIYEMIFNNSWYKEYEVKI